jgi:hypothetical protein
MYSSDGRRDFLKQLAVVAGGIAGLPELMARGVKAGRAMPPPNAAAPRRSDAFTRLRSTTCTSAADSAERLTCASGTA